MEVEDIIENHDSKEPLTLRFLDATEYTITVNEDASLAYGINSNIFEDNCIEEETQDIKPNIITKTENKKRKINGLPYISTNGKFVPGKMFVHVTHCCDNLCHNKFTKSLQQLIFHEFYGLADFNAQSAFIFHHISVKPVARHYTVQNRTLRNNTRRYYLTDEDGKDINVCKGFFKSLLHVSDGRIDRLLKQKNDSLIAPIDKRGKYIRTRGISQAIVQEVYNLIPHLPSFGGTIGKQQNEPDLKSLSACFALLFKEYCDLSQTLIPETIFYHICNVVLESPDPSDNLSLENTSEYKLSDKFDNETMKQSPSAFGTQFEHSDEEDAAMVNIKMGPNNSKKIPKKSLRKQNRVLGLSYTNVNGKLVPAKIQTTVTHCCFQQCHKNFPKKLQEDLFKSYYSLGSYNDQTEFIFNHINVKPVARHYKSNELRQKNKKRKYFLPHFDGCNKAVCKNFFKKVLAVSDGRIDRTLKGSEPPKDKRGHHTPPNKTPDEKVQDINSVIDTYTEDTSNYSSKGKLSIRKMYYYYAENVSEPVSEGVFRNIYNSRFN